MRREMRPTATAASQLQNSETTSIHRTQPSHETKAEAVGLPRHKQYQQMGLASSLAIVSMGQRALCSGSLSLKAVALVSKTNSLK